ncbi:hypothetical protein FGE12_21615 [Aggregicoccus sp. 17bor-14]|uniref:hypothetical protein n=1 Tax=Myxococcaceae TaxID=31 RepID=UPI00129C7F14|nr:MULTISPECIES: hypothetical protein [Myxococcaceae]MBF5045015.1 hypothetical protein [Simulacricoccus sp. 17bor-14]MRI90758.1 hypothetical protein [Aggregicoccus sp. 17bor-14]
MKTPLLSTPSPAAPRLEGTLLAGLLPLVLWLLLWVGVTFAVLAPLGQLLAQPPVAGALTA